MKKILIYTLAFTIALTACQKETEKIDEDKINAKSTDNTPLVEVSVVKPKDWHTEILSQGKLLAVQKAELRFKISGQLQKINVKNGQKVQKGQLLAALDNSEAIQNLQLAEVNLQKAASDRYIKLIERSPTGDTADVPQNKKQLIDLTTGYKSALVNVAQARYKLSLTRLYAPFSGVIANLVIRNYNYISPAEVFCLILDNSSFYIDFNILESELSSVKKGMPLTLRPLMNEQKSYRAKIAEINPLVDKNGMVKIRAKVAHSQDLTEGMQMNVSLMNVIKNQIVVPKKAVIERSGKYVAFVYVSGLAKWHYVEIGGENSTSYLINEGLQNGDSLIVSNNFNLVHDSEVRLTSN